MASRFNQCQRVRCLTVCWCCNRKTRTRDVIGSIMNKAETLRKPCLENDSEHLVVYTAIPLARKQPRGSEPWENTSWKLFLPMRYGYPPLESAGYVPHNSLHLAGSDLQDIITAAAHLLRLARGSGISTTDMVSNSAIRNHGIPIQMV
jgi:hypothetical protein